LTINISAVIKIKIKGITKITGGGKFLNLPPPVDVSYIIRNQTVLHLFEKEM
jgi:phosphoribosylaminoimidazole (AIR) synthetase